MSGPDSSGPPGAQSQPAPPPKPRLKINVSRSASFAVDGTSTPARAGASASGDANATPSAVAATTPATATPSEGGRKKLKLKISQSQPPTPAASAAPPVGEDEHPIIKTKAGRQSRPSQKLVESKKRTRDDEDDDDERPLAMSMKPQKKIMIRQLNTPKAGATQLVVKPRGKPPVHPPGDGYDSEASDRELDPAIEEQIILRVTSPEHAEYLRTCIETGKMGVSRAQGGADVHIKFFEEDTRRSVVTIKGQPFAAVLVDLPTITEAMKTWDKKSFMKSADICQMLLAFQKVSNEQEARNAPLPSMIDSNFKWPHGLTPPMHDAVNRRFAKTISRKEIEDKEAEVERLLAEDAKAASSRWEWVDDRQQDNEDEEEEEEEDAEGEDAEGEDDVGYFDTQPAEEEEMDLGLDDDLAAAFADDLFADAPIEGETPAVPQDGSTPVVQESIEADADLFAGDGDEDDDDDDDDDDDEDDLNDDEREERDQVSETKHLIAGMQKQKAQKIAERDSKTNPILRKRLDDQIRQLTSEIALKKSAIGLEDDDDDEV